jgi:hypothetical protein
MTMLRRFLLVLAAVVLAAGAGTVPDARAGTTVTREPFDSATWWQRWGMATAPFNTEVVGDGDGGSFLRVHIAEGAHDGSSFLLPTGDADHVRLTYRLRVDDAFDPSAADHDVKLPGFGKPVFAAGGQCLVACGGAPGDGVLGYSARTDVDDHGTPGFYVYDTTLHRWGRGFRWTAGPLVPGVWHTVRLEIEMNDPARDDGVLLADLDGTRVFTATDLHLRWTSLLHVGGAWFDIYYGGAGVSPAATAVDVDDATIEVR